MKDHLEFLRRLRGLGLRDGKVTFSLSDTGGLEIRVRAMFQSLQTCVDKNVAVTELDAIQPIFSDLHPVFDEIYRSLEEHVVAKSSEPGGVRAFFQAHCRHCGYLQTKDGK